MLGSSPRPRWPKRSLRQIPGRFTTTTSGSVRIARQGPPPPAADDKPHHGDPVTDDEIQLHQTDDGNWVVAYRHMWLEGVYDTTETARRAVGYSDHVLSRLSALSRMYGENRPVTQADFDEIDSFIERKKPP